MPEAREVHVKRNDVTGPMVSAPAARAAGRIAYIACLMLEFASFNAHPATAQEGDGVLDPLGGGDELGKVKSLKDPVTLEYRNAPLVDVLRSLADSARINLALSTEVAESKDSVTIRLANVSYEIALKTILDLYKLGAVVDNGILRIDTLRNLSRERQEKVQSQSEIWASEPTRTLIFQVNYAKAGELAAILESMSAPFRADKRFSVTSDPRTNRIMIVGVADALVRSRSLLEGLDRRKQQVLVEARIVEASSELSRTLSVTWGTRFGLDAQRGLSSGVVFPNSVVGNVGGAGSLGGTAPAPGQGMGPTQLGSMGFTLGSINGMVNIDGILRAYETESLANIIASPRIVVEDQEEATIDETGQVERNVLVGDAPQRRSTSSRLFLSVKPQITSDNTLELQLQVQRKTPNNAPTDPVQGTTDRTVKTKLMVENGETAVIGGLYQTQKFKGQGRIPFLGRLPIIGFLFRTNDTQSARSELMVLITPRILPNSRRTGEDALILGNGNSGAERLPSSLTGVPSVENAVRNNAGGSNVMANGGSRDLNKAALDVPEGGGGGDALTGASDAPEEDAVGVGGNGTGNVGNAATGNAATGNAANGNAANGNAANGNGSGNGNGANAANGNGATAANGNGANAANGGNGVISDEADDEGAGDGL